MKDTALVSIFIGLLVIVARGPLIFAPAASREFYVKLLSTNLRMRLFGLFMFALSLAMIFTARGEINSAAILILVLGYLLAFVSVFGMIVFASIIRLVVEAVLEGMDDLMLRLVGIISLFFGAFFFYLGWYLWTH